MDFFAAQELARRNTKWLVAFFVLAVICINLALYLVALVLFGADDGSQMADGSGLWQPDIFMTTCLVTCSIIAIGSLWKSRQLGRGGGSAVAESLGGTAVASNTQDLAERRLLNVVEEMAIASGMAIPRVYILHQEASINAFAAGLNTSDAVVAVTKGALEQLNREELQGVIGHEFSHIFNGDMRLNLRLMGIIHGILLIAIIGRVLMQSSSNSSRSSSSKKDSGGAAILMAGLALFIIGYIGVFFGNLIKAAVSRQREFLADASSVQFSRNPQGLSNALQKIAGLGADASRIENPEAEAVSHMFFGQGISVWFGLLDTHPPVRERILRLQPELKAQLDAAQQQAAAGSARTQASDAAMGFAAGGLQLDPNALRQSIGTVNDAQLAFAQQVVGGMDESVRELMKVPSLARRLVYALLVAQAKAPEAELEKALGPERELDVAASLELIPKVKEQGRALWLPMLDLALPALRELPPGLRQELIKESEVLVMADGKVNFFEFALLSLLEQQLGPKERPRLRRYEPKNIREDCAYLLSFMAHAGQQQPQAIEAAFDAASKKLKLEGDFVLSETKDLGFARSKAVLGRIASLKPRFKARLIEALVIAIAADGKVELLEAELLRAIGARFDCPVPPLAVGQL